ncbi:MAG: hypothetical protein IPF81_19090 [Bacteroidetes bacterium]|nr:hypothetical protein [Bacteroidota bacterium]
MTFSFRSEFLILTMILFCVSGVVAQDSSNVRVSGRAFQSGHPEVRLDDLMILNLRTSQGVFGKADGSFRVLARKTDTLLVASTGYEYKRITITDTTTQPSYYIDVPLIKLNVRLKEVVIFAPGDLENIYKDIEKLGYNKRDFQIGGVPALQKSDYIFISGV